MPDVYRSGEGIRELRGRVRGGAAVVLHAPYEISGLIRLVKTAAALPGDPMTTVYRSLTGTRDLAAWEGWNLPEDGDGTNRARAPHPEELHDVVARVTEALRIAENAWSGQGDEIGDLALAFAVPRPRRKRMRLEARRPALVLDGGSIRARFASAGQRLREFGVALFPVARSRRQSNLVEALRARAIEANGLALPRLEALTPEQLADKDALVVFVHGLLSTDAGTFDGLVQALAARPAAAARLFLAGWPHDTLARIDDNASELAELIEDAVGSTKLPVAFVCHSRGGLVARACAAELVRINRSWSSRLRGCVTFGTPHRGAELAEVADEMLGKVLVMKMASNGGRVVPLLDALWAVRNRKKLPGITDLRPRRNGGRFLRRLEKREARQSGRAGGRVLPILAVGGRVRGGGTGAWLSKRFLGGVPNDLVVPVTSSMPPRFKPAAEAECDHFSYCADDGNERLTKAVAFLESALSLPPPPAAPPKENGSEAKAPAAGRGAARAAGG